MDCKELVSIEDAYQELEINLAEPLNCPQAWSLTVFSGLATRDSAWFFLGEYNGKDISGHAAPMLLST